MKLPIEKNNFLLSRLFHIWFALILIGLSVFVIYGNIYNCPFVFDDIRVIVENRTIRDLSNFFSIEKLLKPRAIVDFTFALNYRYGKLDVFGYHLVNVLIHILNGIVVYFLAITILDLLSRQSSLAGTPVSGTRDYPILTIALFSSLLFVVHPIQTQAVTYTVQRYASMAAFFYMASVLLYLKARIIQQKSKIREDGAKCIKWATIHKIKLSSIYTLSAIYGILAFISKQNTASLPGVILLVEYLLIDRTWQGWKKKAPFFILVFGLWMLFTLYITGFFDSGFEGRRLLEDVSGMTKETENVSRWQYLCTQFNVLVIYIRLLFLPVNQNLDYMYPFKNGFFDSYTPFAFLFLVCLVSIGIWQIKKRPVISLAILWFFITLSVESSIIPIKDAIFEHRLYLPMFGFGLIVAYLFFDLLSRQQFCVIIISVLIIISLGLATIHRNSIWQNKIKLWSDVVSKSPKNPRAYNNIGVALNKQERTSEAIEYYLEALSIMPDYVDAQFNIGLAMDKQGNIDEAIKHYSEVLRKKPDYEKAHNNLGAALDKQERTEEAIKHYLQSLKIKPDYIESYINLGAALDKQGRRAAAIKQYIKVLQIDPDNEEAHYNMGLSLSKQGRTSAALEHYLEVLKLRPDHIKAQNNTGVLLNKKGRTKEAIAYYLKALRINPNYEQAHNNIGSAYEKLGRNEKAMHHYLEAIRIKPDFTDAHYNMGAILGKQGRNEEAFDQYLYALQANPDHTLSLNNIGIYLVEKGRLKEAINYFLKALQKKPNFIEAHNNLAIALFRNGDIEGAIRHFRDAIQINSDNAIAKINLKKLLILQKQKR
jgi:protein O-mannosyl-transferase